MNLFDFSMREPVRKRLQKARSMVCSDPAAAMRICRPIAKSGGAAAAAAHVYWADALFEAGGAARLVHAEAHYRVALAARSALWRAWLGLGGVFDKQDRLREAEAAYARGVKLLAAALRGVRGRFRQILRRDAVRLKGCLAGEKDPKSLRDAETWMVDADAVRTLVDAAAQLCELRHALGVRGQRSPIDESVLAWACAEPELLEEGEPDWGMDTGTWTHFHSSWAALRALTGRLDEAIGGLAAAVEEGRCEQECATELEAQLRERAAEAGAPARGPRQRAPVNN